MASSYSTLGQVNPSATTLTTLYTCPAATSAVCSTLVVCNLSTAASIRVAVRPAGAAIANQHYIVYDAVISANDSVFLTLGLSLATGTVVSVYASSANVSFNLYGSEIA